MVSRAQRHQQQQQRRQQRQQQQQQQGRVCRGRRRPCSSHLQVRCRSQQARCRPDHTTSSLLLTWCTSRRCTLSWQPRWRRWRRPTPSCSSLTSSEVRGGGRCTDAHACWVSPGCSALCTLAACNDSCLTSSAHRLRGASRHPTAALPHPPTLHPAVHASPVVMLQACRRAAFCPCWRLQDLRYSRCPTPRLRQSTKAARTALCEPPASTDPLLLLLLLLLVLASCCPERRGLASTQHSRSITSSPRQLQI